VITVKPNALEHSDQNGDVLSAERLVRRTFVEPSVSEPRSLLRSASMPMMAMLAGSGGGVGLDPDSSFPPDGSGLDG
jgi:hypothetical protein